MFEYKIRHLRYEIQLYHSSAVAQNIPDDQIKSDSGMLPLVALNASHPVGQAHLSSSVGAGRHFVAQADPATLKPCLQTLG